VTDVTVHPRPLPASTVGYAAVFVLFAVSGIVYFEPAPFDYGIVALAAIYFLFGLRFPPLVLVPFFLLGLFFVFGLIGAISGDGFAKSRSHILITGYLSVAAIFIGCLVAKAPERSLRVMLTGYCLAAVIAAVAAIIGYFQLIDGAAEQFTLYGRARGPFKDPNVFGPFLIVPALYSFYKMTQSTGLKSLIWSAVMGSVTVGILLAFSRGAWGHYILSFAICLGLMFNASSNPRFKLRLTLVAIGAFALVVCVLAIMLNMEAVSVVLKERLQFLQSYDLSGSDGRFAGQWAAIKTIMSNPFGVGFGGFVKKGTQLAPHNVYLYSFLLSGWFGGAAYHLLVFVTLIFGLRLALIPSPIQGLCIILFSTFAGLAILGLVVDTDHWRHFYLIIGMIWGSAAYLLGRRSI
jgi:hypothetical protein